MPTQFDIVSLIQGLQIEDPRLYEALTKLNDEINTIYGTLYPIEEFVRTASTPLPLPKAVDSFVITVGPDYIFLVWTTSDPNIRFYELRRQLGLSTDWDTADFVTRTTTLQATLDPTPEGDYTYLLKTLNANGSTQSSPASSVTAHVTKPNPPMLTGQVIDNSVLLFWTPSPITSFRIREYNIYKEGEFIGSNNGTFSAFFELIAGDYMYSVTSVDIAGNESDPASIVLSVKQPPDFELQDDRFSDLSGIKVDCFVYDNTLIVDHTITETWEDHFLNNTWDQIQDQLDAGFPLYIQPADYTDPASYQEEIDYGVVFTNVIFNVLTTVIQLDGETLIGCQIDYKVLPGDSWIAAPAGFSTFIPSAQFIRVTLTFTSSDATAILQMTSLRYLVNVKQVMDSGQVDALAADALGTLVTFSIPFLDVKSLTATVGDVLPYTVVIDFVDAPNPTDFRVYVFDTAGARIDALVYWKARGIV